MHRVELQRSLEVQSRLLGIALRVITARQIEVPCRLAGFESHRLQPFRNCLVESLLLRKCPPEVVTRVREIRFQTRRLRKMRGGFAGLPLRFQRDSKTVVCFWELRSDAYDLAVRSHGLVHSSCALQGLRQ